MKYIEVRENNKNKFEEFVNNNKYATCMQMWGWAEFRNEIEDNLYTRVGIVSDKSEFYLTATYAIHRFNILGKVLYIPQGPIWSNEKALTIFVRNIRKVANQNNCFAVVCEPRVRKNDKRFNQLIDNKFKYTDEAVQPRDTVFIDLTKSEKELMYSFSKSTRYNIRYARKKGIVVKRYTSEKDVDRIDGFYKLIKKTQKRKYFYVQDKRYFVELWKKFSRNNQAILYEARYKGEVLGIIVVLYNNIWASSLFSSTTRKYANLKPIYLARWESIKDAKSIECKIYDFFGATRSKDKKHPFYYTTQHKLGFGQRVEEFAGTFEIVLDPFKYKLWRLLENQGIFRFYERTFLKLFNKKNVKKEIKSR